MNLIDWFQQPQMTKGRRAENQARQIQAKLTRKQQLFVDAAATKLPGRGYYHERPPSEFDVKRKRSVEHRLMHCSKTTAQMLQSAVDLGLQTERQSEVMVCRGAVACGRQAEIREPI